MLLWSQSIPDTVKKRVSVETAPHWCVLWSGASNRKFARGISFLVNQNLRIPPLALQQSRASRRAKEEYQRLEVSVLDEECGMKHDLD